MWSNRFIALACGVAMFAASLLFAVPAYAAGGASAIADCNAHNTLTHTYSIAQLESALRTMPADVSEYTDCKDVITRELLIQQGKLKAGSGGGGGGSGGGGSSFLPTPVIVVLVALLLAAATLGALAIRRRREPADGAPQPPSTSS